MSEKQLIPTPSLFGETGNFLLEREMGRGGMGGVYLGRDKMLDRPVAVKVMLKEYGDDPEFVEKFKREAQAAARLIHPNIAQIYTYGIANGMPYIAMELVAGGSLDQLMQHSGASIDITRVMKIGEQVAQALRCAADQGLVHGDVKPENILLDANGNAKLVDFGLAAMQKNTNEIWGTPYYIAPEKVKKEAVDFRADMYSLGGTLYHALTGVAPFEGDDAAAVVRKRFEGAPVPPSQIRPGISPQIDALILKMLALDPAERYPSFEALLEEFKSIMTYGLTPGGTGRMPTGTLPTGHKIGIKGRKRFKMKTSTALSGAGSETAEGEAGGNHSPTPQAEKESADDEGGSVVGKVLGVIGITVGAIALVAGLLVWYVIADRNARAAEKQAQITRELDRAHTSISETRKNAAKFRDEISEMARKAVADCDKATASLTKELSGKVDDVQLDSIKPPPSAELLAAIAMTNAAAQVVSGGTNVAEKAEAAGTNAVESAASAAAAPAADAPAAEEAPATAAPASGGDSEEAEMAAIEASFRSRVADMVTSAKHSMGELWERAYSCEAASIRICKAIDDLVAKIDGFKVEGNDEDAMKKAADFSNVVKGEYETIKAGEDVSKVQKAGNYIRQRGGNTIQQTINGMLKAVKEMERQIEALKKKLAEKKRQEDLARLKAKTIEEDNQRIREKFDSLAEAGTFRQLNWSGAIRQLQTVHDECKYSESQILARINIKKVTMMATVQEVFVANCKGYKFQRSKLAGHTIADISEKDGLKLLKPDGKTQMKMTWVKFYQQYHGNLNELIIRFIEKGKDSSKLKDGKRLSLQPWADAMMGAALTMQIICGDDPTAASRAEQIAKSAVKALPEYLGHAQEIFPDFTFDAASEE